MNLKLILPLFLSLSLVACVTVPISNEGELTELQQVSAQITSLQQSFSEQFSKSCDIKIGELTTKVEALNNNQKTPKVVERCANRVVAKDLEAKLLLGAVEKVTLSKEEVTLDARIDTGADTSSMGVYRVRQFERDGKKWVRFALSSKKNATLVEYPIFDTVKIKQSDSVTEDRIEIKIDIALGKHKYKKQLFNLADRSYLDYQLLIGRSFLRDIAVVDVSRKFLVEKK